MDIEARQIITRARSRLILSKPFFGYLSLYLEPEERCDLVVPTMGTDGVKLYYDPGFIKSFSIDLIMGVIAHEVCHAAFGDIWRRGNRDKIRWNIASDAVRNYHLLEDGFQLPAGCIQIKGAGDLSVEELYEELIDEDGSTGKTLDDHNIWDEAKEELTLKEAKELEQKWRENTSRARQICKLQGIDAGSFEDLIDDLLEPKISWRELLRNYIISSTKNDFRLIPPSKRHLWRGLYLPSTYGEEIELVFALDVSGSMSNEELKDGLSEVKGICEQFTNYTIHFFQCDWDIQEYRQLTTYNFDFPKKIKGRGGTRSQPVFEEVSKRGISPGCLIYFTDLYTVFPDSPPPYPVIWLVTESKTEVPFGKVIKYKR